MLEYWMWLAHRPGINDHAKILLLQHFGSPEAVYHADASALAQFPDIRRPGREALRDKNLEPYTKALEVCGKEKIQILTYQDEAYPERLKHIFDPPAVLYYKGTLPDFDALPAVGIVGTRKATSYGTSTAQRLGYEITRCGGLVVSGLAAGIDAAATRGALRAPGAAVGVLGCGPDVVYPSENRSLYAEMEQQGCILSEFLPGTPPMKWNFPKRNRIISGLSCGVVVVEAPEVSGALRTARDAMEQGRDVFAVPGNVDLPTFSGSNRLIQDGAGAVFCGWDVMREYANQFPDKIHRDEARMESAAAAKVAQEPRTPRKKPEPKPASLKKDIDNGQSAPYIDLDAVLQKLSDEERAIVSAIGPGERIVDDVIAASGLPSGKVLGMLTMLELKKVIVRLPGKRIALRK